MQGPFSDLHPSGVYRQQNSSMVYAILINKISCTMANSIWTASFNSEDAFDHILKFVTLPPLLPGCIPGYTPYTTSHHFHTFLIIKMLSYGFLVWLSPSESVPSIECKLLDQLGAQLLLLLGTYHDQYQFHALGWYQLCLGCISISINAEYWSSLIITALRWFSHSLWRPWNDIVHHTQQAQKHSTCMLLA
jgi:hypothetical protein